MAIAFNVALHVVLVGSILLFGTAMVQLVVQEPNYTEKLMRSLALVAGAVVALGAQASGGNFADFAVHSLAGARPVSAGAVFAATVLPGGAGALFGWYFNQVWKKSASKGMRFVVFVGMLTAVSFAEIYAVATKTNGVILGKAAIPNASFIAGIVLTMLIVVDGPEGRTARGQGLGAFANLVRGRVAPKKGANFVSELAPQGQPARPNPFARD